MSFSIAGIAVTVLCLPLLGVIFYILLCPMKRIEAAIERLEQKTLETMDPTLATSVPLQLAKEINSCTLEEAVVKDKQQQ